MVIMKKMRCEDKNCKGYGKELVDKGYGYLVCVTNPTNNNKKVIMKNDGN